LIYDNIIIKLQIFNSLILNNKKMVKKSFAQSLADLNILNPKEIEQYRIESINNNQPLYVYLKTNNILNDDIIAKVYANQFDTQYIDHINEKMVPPELISKIPLKFLRDNSIIPIKFNDEIRLVVSDPNNFKPIDELSMILSINSKPLITTKKNIIDSINRYYPLEGTKEMIEELEEENNLNNELDFSEIQEEDILGMANEAPIIKLVNHILYQAVKKEASDIHIEPFEKELRVRYRIDGVMYPSMNPPKRIQSALISRLKIMAHLNIAEKRIPQDGRIQIKIADKSIDIRVSILPVSFGERVVMRLLDKTKTFGSLDTLGFSKRDFTILKNSIAQPNGILLITGPTGSGKTSTLYSILSNLNSPEVNIVTVEDPVEYQMAGIGQVQVKENIGLTFAAALRSILRQDPDIVMIGETRDKETAQIAIQAALTGHFVLSTLHTNSSAATITRLIDMGIEPFLISSTIISVIAQRLIRKLCPECKEIYKPEAEILKKIHIDYLKASQIEFYKPKGCEICSYSGYKGRLAIFEIMAMTPDIAKLTIEKADTAIIEEQAIKDGMTLLVEDGIKKAIEGLTSIEEVLSAATFNEI